MSKKLHTILNERYRPDTLEGYICKDEIRAKFEEFIKQQIKEGKQDEFSKRTTGKTSSCKSSYKIKSTKPINCTSP